MIDKKRVCAVVLAAGQGKRMNSDIPKQFMMLDGRPVIYYALNAFENSQVDDIILVTGQESLDYCRHDIVEKYGFRKVKNIIAGGAQRYDSVTNGLRACSDCIVVLIHDGARPMVTPELINRNIACAYEQNACVTAVPSKDTVKIADADNFVESTPIRSRVWIIQTPQSFRYEIIREAYEKRLQADDNSVTDDAMVVEKYMNVKIKLLEGEYTNIKMTTPEDKAVLETMLRAGQQL